MKTQRGRITIPKTAGLFALWFSFLVLITPELSAQKPNVLLILADDLGAENLACYGNTVHKTPVLDRMASEGRPKGLVSKMHSQPPCVRPRGP